eukprot:3478769-Alexandrium_andersonii.AAC.1
MWVLRQRAASGRLRQLHPGACCAEPGWGPAPSSAAAVHFCDSRRRRRSLGSLGAYWASTAAATLCWVHLAPAPLFS